MIAKIVDNHWIYLIQMPVEVEKSISDHFSVRDPRAHYIDSEFWDGWYRKYDAKNRRLSIAFLDELKTYMTRIDVPLEIFDERPPIERKTEDQVTKDMLAGVTLEDYQIGAIKSTCNNEIGNIMAPTGAGKTEIICGIVKLHDCPSVIITEQTVVLNQIVDRLQIRKVSEKVDKFCHGHLPTGRKIMVGSIQSIFVPTKPNKVKITLNRNQVFSRLLKMIERKDENLTKILPPVLVDAMMRNPEGVLKLKGTYYALVFNYLRDLEYDKRKKWHATRYDNADIIKEALSTSDMICVDEADLASTTQYSKLFRTVFNGRRRFGFSGTFDDPGRPIQNLFIKENLGSVIYKVPRQEVQERGRIIPVRPIFIIVGKDGDKNDRRAYDIAMREEIIENEVLHNKIKTVVDSFPKDKTLILLDTSPIGELGMALMEKIPGSRFLWNKSSRPERDECLKMFEGGELGCLIGGKIFQRGLDLLGGVDNLIIVGGGKQHSNINQMVGRAVRRNARGWARIFLFFFLNNKYLYSHSRENIKAIAGLGYNSKVWVGNKLIDGNKFIKSRFRIPK